MTKLREAARMALEALKANSLLVNGDDKSAGLVWCMDGYYSDCFDIESANKQTDEAINALQEAIAEPEPRNQCAETCERAKLCAVCLAEMTADREPVAEVAEVAQAYDGQWTAIVVTGDVELQPGTKLYTSPRPRRNVTYVCPACHFIW
jgi:hypothetical protein